MYLKAKINCSGYCTHPECSVLRRGGFKSRSFPATYLLIEHPTHGLSLYDTGYGEAFLQGTSSFPMSIYRKVTPVFFTPQQSAKAQLAQQGITASDIRYIFISHFHGDHIGGISDFPNATYVCSRAGYNSIKNKRGLFALIHGFVPNTLPLDFSSRVEFIEDSSICLSHPLMDYFKNVWDFFGDQSLYLVELPGHAPGQLGALIKRDNEYLFVIADAAWTIQSVVENIAPIPLAALLFDNWSIYKQTLSTLNKIHFNDSNIKIFPVHCQETFDLLKG
jgi:glyoxylase-like metal-dependent hydrolase (beta-lactamase superfamily II)